MNKRKVYQYTRDAYTISTDQTKLDIDTIHGYLERSYWTPGIPKETVAQAIKHSLCFGLYASSPPLDEASKQIGFARVVTDYASFAYLADVFVLPAHEGKGLGSWLVERVTRCSALENVRSFMLATRDAHGLYAKFGFEGIDNPQRLMIKKREMPWYRSEMLNKSD